MTVVDVSVIGSVNLDLVAHAERLPAPGETVLGDGFAEHPGGKGLNQAVAAARAGARTALTASIGDDHAGALLTTVMDEANIRHETVRRRADRATGRAVIGVSVTGENSIIVVPGANATLSEDDARSAPDASIVIAQLEIPLPAVRAAFVAGRAGGATTVLNPSPSAALDDDLIGLCDIVIPNEHEIGALGGATRLLGLGVGIVVVTRGARGVEWFTRDGGDGRIPAFDVDTIDTTGAGDAFCGAFAAALTRSLPLTDAVRFAAAAGALATTVAGAVPSLPHRVRIERLLTQRA